MRFEDVALLKAILLVEIGICNGFYIGPTGKITCGIGHNIEAHPIARNLMCKWLRKGMTDDEAMILLDKDIISVNRLMGNLFNWENHSIEQRIGWTVLAMKYGIGVQIRVYREVNDKKSIDSVNYKQEILKSILDITGERPNDSICDAIVDGNISPSFISQKIKRIKPTFVI